MPVNKATLDKVALLIPRLATDHDGEVISTVRAIMRTLEKGGADLHDLAASFGGETVRVVFKEQGPQGGAWHDKATWCAERSDALNPKEAEFVQDMRVKLKWQSEPTERQAAWLDSIFERLKRQERQHG